MKTKSFFQVLVILLIVFSATAQQGINYKAIINNTNGDAVINTVVIIQFTILENGTFNVYQETHTSTTDANGIFIVNIGEGAVVSGDFSTIAWGSNPHFLKTEIDKGDGLTDMGTTELKAVPYALYTSVAESAKTLLNPTDLGRYYFADKDGDNFGDSFSPVFVPSGVSPPTGFVIETNDCNDNDSKINPGATEICGDGIDQDCDGADLICPEELDDDGDGYSENDGDCDDSDNSIYPNAPEICEDGIDQDCDGSDLVCYNYVTDIDGNNYGIVTIGDQTWMNYNLRTTTYNDGTSIPYVALPEGWVGLTAPAYCWYIEELFVIINDAALYNFYAVETGKLCPSGWHVPSDEEWTALEDYISEQGLGVTESIALKATSGWNNDGNGTDNYGFSALPGGYLNGLNETFSDRGNYGYWWSSSESDSDNAYIRFISYEYEANVSRISDYKLHGFSVRCIKDNDGSATLDIDDDGDGYSENDGDCDDTDVNINPGAVEIPGNGIDEDCDGKDLTTNSPPTAPTIKIVGQSRDENLLCEIVVGSTDSDADPITYYYSWYIDGVFFAETSNTLSSQFTEAGNTITCKVVAFDGTDSSEESEVQVIITAFDAN